MTVNFMDLEFQSIATYIFGGITFPAIISGAKKILNYGTWKIIDYERHYDPLHEFYPGFSSEKDEHIFKVENVSASSWVFKDAIFNDEQDKPYLFISGNSGPICIKNEDSYEKVDPSYRFDGYDYPAGSCVLTPKSCIKIILQHTKSLKTKPLIISFERYADSNSIASRIQKIPFLHKSKIELRIP